MSAAARVLTQLGPMRITMFLFALVLIAFVPAPGTPVSEEGFAMVPTLLFPVLAPLLFMLLLLDAIMGGIFMADKTGAERARFRVVVWVNLVLALVLVVFWMPYYRGIMGGG